MSCHSHFCAPTDDIKSAYKLIKDVEPSSPQEYILKAVCNAAIGQETNSRELLKLAQNYYQLVGSAASECGRECLLITCPVCVFSCKCMSCGARPTYSVDTIPGRHCMASCYFLLKQFEDVLIYLNSIKSYFYNDDTFNFNLAQAAGATGNFQEAEEVLLLVQSEKVKQDFVYISWLARCFIMNRKPEQAWELYLKMETSADSFSLLQLIANSCYKMGQFFFAAKAFDVLEKLDPNPEYWEGKRGACIGQFQLVIAGREPRETLRDIVQILQETANSQSELIMVAIKKWAKDNKFPISGAARRDQHPLSNI
jgi:intraflagellar transport protein 56